jgi:hypothetical protein
VDTDSSWVPATVRACYTKAPGDPATNRPHETKDADDLPSAPAQLAAESWTTVHPPYQDVPKTATVKYALLPEVLACRLCSQPPTADIRDGRSSTSWNNIQGCGSLRSPASYGSSRPIVPSQPNGRGVPCSANFCQRSGIPTDRPEWCETHAQPKSASACFCETCERCRVNFTRSARILAARPRDGIHISW